MKTKIVVSSLFYIAAMFLGSAASEAVAADITTLTGPCEDCHGKDGVSKESKIPTIAGYSAMYITDSLALYRDKTRPCEDMKYPEGKHKGDVTDMCKIAEKLSKEESGLIAEHYASKPFVPAKQSFDADLAKTGKGIHVLNCKKCHEDGGSSPDDDAGILAGQWMPYLEDQFKEYASDKRPMPEKMKPKMEKLSESDIKALIHYYGSQQ